MVLSTANKKNINQDNQEIPHSQSNVFSRDQAKGRWETDNDKTNSTYEITDAQTKKNCNGGTLRAFTL